VVEHVALLVAYAALRRRAPADHGADRLAQRLGAVDDEQDALLGIEPAVATVAFSVELSHRPSGIFTPSLVIRARRRWCGPFSSMLSIITARRTSSSRRLMSAI
jgi:hypothetical protein